MPLHKIIHINENTTAYFWHITEDVTSLFRAVSLRDTSLFRLEGMKSEEHQKGFLAVRMLLQHLGYTDYDLTYDEAGKPHLSDGKHISISHSHEFSCICISNKLMGIDLENLEDCTKIYGSKAFRKSFHFGTNRKSDRDLGCERIYF